MTIRKIKGFTILELMVTLTVLGVLMAIAVPSFRGTMRRARVSNAVNTMVGDMQFSRSEAATRRQFVSICRSADGKTCALSGPDYDVGYLMYAYDASAAGANQVYDATKHTLLRTTPSTTDVSIQATDANIVTFGQTGLPVANGTRTSMQFVFCARAPGKTSGAGLNNNESPGSRVTLGVSGSLVNTKLASSANCMPTG
ncbi:GspH/FimT family pseudopilin [Luteibacter sp. W1I16]|uniref:GspH/FimT family pseudopilin n=1 Tax=Luteibacter sp. W1I16 TaxID=3373922 RepID=UPI003D247826